jgi:hypothetical protein
MKKQGMTKAISAGLIVLSIAVLTLSYTKKVQAQTEKKVNVGFIADFTKAYAASTKQQHMAWGDLIRDSNDRGGIGPEHIKVDMLWGDDTMDIKIGTTIYESLEGKGIVYLKILWSQLGLALKPRWSKIGLPVSTTYPAFSLMVPPTGITSFYPTTVDQITAYCDWIKDVWKAGWAGYENRKPRLAYMAYDSPSSREPWIPELRKYIKDSGIELVAEEYYPPMPIDTTPNLLRVKDKGADFVFAFCVLDSAQLMKDAIKLGMLGKGKRPFWCFCHCADWEAIMKMVSPSEVEGVRFTSHRIAWHWDEPGVKKARELLKKYHGSDKPEQLGLTAMYFDGFAEICLALECIRLASEKVSSSKLDARAVRDYGLYRIKDFDAGGTTPTPLTFSATDNVGATTIQFSEIRNGLLERTRIAYPARKVYIH